MSDFIRVEGEYPPEGYRLVTYQEALENSEKLFPMLEEWDIARLDDGGSMDGPGYGCEIRPNDERTLGYCLCVKE